MSNLHILKEELKSLGKEIRNLKTQRKGSPDGVVYGLERKRYDARHMHIAYCELRGRTREQIEQPAEDNLPSQSHIDFYKDKYGEANEALCACA